VAAAFLRQRQTKLTAPEELLEAGPAERERPQRVRGDFKGGAWISLSVGRNHHAEPRWLLPMLCRAGKITKAEIGAIKIHQNESYVELTAECVDGFLAAIGPGRKVDKTVTVDRVKGPPGKSGGNFSAGGGNKPKRRTAGSRPERKPRPDNTASGNNKTAGASRNKTRPKKRPTSTPGDRPLKRKAAKK